jgi:PAS domain S-box-containing protein
MERPDVSHERRAPSESERTAVEAKLRLRERDLVEAHRIARLGTWRWNRLTDTVTWSDEVYRIFSRDPRLPPPTYAQHPEAYTPDSWFRLGAAVDRAIATGEPYELDLEVPQPEGPSRWITARGEVEAYDHDIVTHLRGTIQEITDRKRAEERLTISENRYRSLAKASAQIVWSATIAGEAMNELRDWDEFTGQSAGASAGYGWADAIHPEDRALTVAAWQVALTTGGPFEVEQRLRRHDGEYRHMAVRGTPVRDRTGTIVEWVGTHTDITEQRRVMADLVRLNTTLEERVEARTRELQKVEEALRQAQKMEAIGQLTGGIAHDFNNLLTGIMGSLEVVRRRINRLPLPEDERAEQVNRFIDAATASATRAAALTHRLLAFARRQPLDMRPTNVAALIHGMTELVQRTLDEQVHLRIAVAPDCWHTLTDANQLESSILNLSINARDAMRHGGFLTIAATNVTLDAETTRALGEIAAGDYVRMTVTDTGVGMAQEVRERAFEPFFTTKPTGLGTGLGLSMVYGFARQSGGFVHLASDIGTGTTVTIYLPRAAEIARTEDAPPSAAPSGFGETVLVIDDVDAVRMLMVDVLADRGYDVIEAENGSQAIPIINSSRKIDLLVTDVGLPGLNGREIAGHARTRRPGMKVLFVTGYAAEAAAIQGFLEPGMALITKPFLIEQLASKVREMIGAG